MKVTHKRFNTSQGDSTIKLISSFVLKHILRRTWWAGFGSSVFKTVTFRLSMKIASAVRRYWFASRVSLQSLIGHFSLSNAFWGSKKKFPTSRITFDFLTASNKKIRQNICNHCEITLEMNQQPSTATLTPNNNSWRARQWTFFDWIDEKLLH